MYVTLPSEDRVPLPAARRTGKAVKLFIEARTQIPRAQQRLYQGDTVIGDGDRLDDLGAVGETALDLVVVIGEAYLVCREGLRGRVEAGGREILHSVRSKLAARKIGDLARYPVVFDPIGTKWDKEQRARCESFAKPFYEAHRQHKAMRLYRLWRTCQGLGRRSFVVSMFNDGYQSMFENWVASCDRHGVDCRATTILFAIDADADRRARDRGFATFYDGVSYGDLPRERSTAFGDERGVRTRFIKLAMVQDMLELGHDILLQDIDMVWLRDPLPGLVAAAERDGLDFQFMDDGFNNYHQPLHYNSGFVFIRNNEFSRFAWRQIYDNFARCVYLSGDQRLINIVVDSLRSRGLRTRALPQNRFVNGHLIHEVNRKGIDLPPDKWVVHASWTANMETKIELLKQHGLWYLDGD